VKKGQSSTDAAPRMVTFNHRVRTFADINKLADHVSQKVVATWLDELLSGTGRSFVVTITAASPEHPEKTRKR